MNSPVRNITEVNKSAGTTNSLESFSEASNSQSQQVINYFIEYKKVNGSNVFALLFLKKNNSISYAYIGLYAFTISGHSL